jgi:hypothetical protein
MAAGLTSGQISDPACWHTSCYLLGEPGSSAGGPVAAGPFALVLHARVVKPTIAE